MALETKDICYELKKLSNLVSRFIRKNYLAYGNKKITRSQAQILEFIYEKSLSNEKVYQKDIELNFSIRRSTATESLNKIENLKMITRKVCETDSRKKEINLTKSAKVYIDEIHSHLKNFAEMISNGITEEEKSTFVCILKKMELNLRKQEQIYEENF